MAMMEYEYEPPMEDPDPFESDPWHDEGIAEWSEWMIGAQMAEETAAGLLVAEWETWAA